MASSSIQEEKCNESAPSSTTTFSIPIKTVSCESDKSIIRLFPISDTEACARWKYGMLYHGLDSFTCKPVTVDSAERKIACTPTYFSVARAAMTHIKYIDNKEHGIAVKINYTGYPRWFDDLIVMCTILCIVVVFVMMCIYCPPNCDYSDTYCDDDFLTGYVIGSWDTGGCDWGTSSDSSSDCIGGWGLAE